MIKTLEHIPLEGELPSPKGAALAILEACRRDDTTTAEIARISQTDPALAGRLIRNANTAANGRRPVVSVTDAIMKLGTGTVRNLALGFSLIDQHHAGPCRGFDYDGFWAQSLLGALAMQHFSAMAGIGVAEELFACGLLSQIGRLALATAYPGPYAELIGQADAPGRLATLERERLHTDHNELTAALLTDWGLPGALVEPILHHECPDSAPFLAGSRPYQLTRLFHLAQRVGGLATAAEAERNRLVPELLLLGGRIGLDAEQLATQIDEVVRNWQTWGELLNVPARALPGFADMAAAPSPGNSQGPEQSGLRVLLVDDDPTARAMLAAALGETLGHQVVTASSGEDALVAALQFSPQIVITDWVMPGMSGLDLCRALRAAEWGKKMYILMLTGLDAREDVAEAFEAGVDDYLGKPVDLRMLRGRLRAAAHYVQLLEAWERDRAQLREFAAELAISNRKLMHAAMTDLLTELPNRRSGLESLSKAWAAASRSGQPLSALLIDVDHFKRINDGFGHAAGDLVLREVAAALQAAARKDDVVCRLGGEEFLVICHNADLRSAVSAAERLRKLVAGLKVQVGERRLALSVSVGVASREDSMTDPDALVNAADKALYGAKESGRNRSCITIQGRLRCFS